MSGYKNIKIQFPYQKSVSGNFRDQDYTDSHSHMISEYNPASNITIQLQKP